MSDLRTAAQQVLEALCCVRDMVAHPDNLEFIDRNVAALRAALAQQDELQGCATEEECTYQPWCRIRGTCQRKQADPDISRCPRCGGAADNGHDRELPPNPYFCSRCMAQQTEPVQEPVDVGLLEYRGNSVAFIHQKMTAYRTGIDAAWDAFRANGLHPDGKTPLADMIAKHTAPPRRTMVPLTEEEILLAVGWERAEMYMKLAPNFPVDEAKQETLKNARAVERAVWEKNHG